MRDGRILTGSVQNSDEGLVLSSLPQGTPIPPQGVKAISKPEEEQTFWSRWDGRGGTGVRSDARQFANYSIFVRSECRVRIRLPHQAAGTARAPPINASTILSARSCRTSRPRLAPSACLMAISQRRLEARAKSRLAMLAHATSNTIPATHISSFNGNAYRFRRPLAMPVAADRSIT